MLFDKCLAVCILFISMGLIACADNPSVADTSEPPGNGDVPADVSVVTGIEADAKTLHTSRYTVASTAPIPEQVLLISQIVDVQMPARLEANVKDGLTFLLQRTGYSLCEEPPEEVRKLFGLPLPAVHYRIGPTTLLSALQLIVGRPFNVEVDDVNRSVCFSLRDEYLMEGTP